MNATLCFLAAIGAFVACGCLAGKYPAKAAIIALFGSLLIIGLSVPVAMRFM